MLLGAGAEADDVVQEALVKAYRGLGGFRDGSPFRPWLLRIVANETAICTAPPDAGDGANSRTRCCPVSPILQIPLTGQSAETGTSSTWTRPRPPRSWESPAGRSSRGPTADSTGCGLSWPATSRRSGWAADHDMKQTLSHRWWLRHEAELRELRVQLAVAEPAVDTVSAVMARIDQEPCRAEATSGCTTVGAQSLSLSPGCCWLCWRSARESGPTLLWQRPGVTLRLEGFDDQRTAVSVAESGRD